MAEADTETDLKDRFSVAAKFLESVTMQLDPSQLLEFYAYYKQATLGKCSIERPSWFNMTARQKWNAWNELGDLDQDEAMSKYICLLTHLFPDWEDTEESSPTTGWVAVSCMAREEPDIDDSEKMLSDWVREGDKEKVKLHAKNNTIDQLDDEGLGPIHWAADRGNLDMLRFLIQELKADMELRDQDGQTALHYAASCGHVAVVKLLVELGANTAVTDADGATPLDATTDPDIATLLS